MGLCAAPGVEQLTALPSREGRCWHLKAGRDAAGRGGWLQAECPPQALLWEHVASSDAPSTGPVPRCPEGGTCVIAWPHSWAPALGEQTHGSGGRSQGGPRGARGTRPRSTQGLSAHASKRAAGQGPLGLRDDSPEALSGVAPLPSTQPRPGWEDPGGVGWGDACEAGSRPPAGRTADPADTPRLQATFLGRGSSLGQLGISPRASPRERRWDESEKLLAEVMAMAPPRASSPHVDPTCRELATASRNCSGLSFLG